MLQAFNNVVMLRCAKNRRRESSSVTSPAVVQRGQRNAQKSVMHVQSCCFVNLKVMLHGTIRKDDI